MFDLTTTQGVFLYLSNTPFAATSVDRLSGGLSAFTYRVTLKCPPEAGPTTLILKHSEDYSAAHPDFKMDPERSSFEYNALRMLWDSGVVSQDSLVQAPRPIHYDPFTHTIFMSDLGSDVSKLSEMLQTAYTQDGVEQARQLASQVGSALGDFLGRFQKWSPQLEHRAMPCHTHRREEIFRIFQGLANRSAVKHGLQGGWFEALLQSERQKASTDSQVLAIGDLWMENILVSQALEHGELRIYLVDWELSRPACPELDLSQLTGIWMSFAQHHRQWLDDDDTFLVSLFRAYREHRTVDPRRMITLTGMYLMGLGTTTPWAWSEGEEFNRVVTLKGHELMKVAHGGDEGAFTSSPFRLLFHQTHLQAEIRWVEWNRV